MTVPLHAVVYVATSMISSPKHFMTPTTSAASRMVWKPVISEIMPILFQVIPTQALSLFDVSMQWQHR